MYRLICCFAIFLLFSFRDFFPDPARTGFPRLNLVTSRAPGTLEVNHPTHFPEKAPQATLVSPEGS